MTQPALFHLHAPNGMRVTLTDLGATTLAIDTPDHDGRFANILLGHASPGDYPAAGAPGPDTYMGATCGRYANRIAGAAFVLDGVRHALTANEGPNQLHGGPRGFHQAIWRVVTIEPQRAVFHHHSPDGDQGFPGALDATATYDLADNGTLTIAYAATTTRPTHVNLVWHGYFNLTGRAGTTIDDHRLRIDATAYLPIDAAAIPTGEQRPVTGTPMDFITPHTVGSRGADYNHNYILPGSGMRDAAWLHDPASGRTVIVATDQPGLQLYDGNALAGGFAPRAGLCLETQGWPDSPNRPEFPTTRLDPGATYRSETRLRFGLV